MFDFLPRRLPTFATNVGPDIDPADQAALQEALDFAQADQAGQVRAARHKGRSAFAQKIDNALDFPVVICGIGGGFEQHQAQVASVMIRREQLGDRLEVSDDPG